jgi:hypothetical protein
MARKKKDRHLQQGDVLGISNATADIPRATTDRGGHPRGIELDEDRPGSRDVEQAPGATSIDMGSGGEGNAIRRNRP